MGTRTVILISMHARVRRMKGLPAITSFVFAACAVALAGSVVTASAAAAKRLVVKVGASRSYTRSELQPGATVVCRYLTRHLSVTAPTGTTLGSGAVWPKRRTADSGLFHLSVTVSARGFQVTCGLGGHHSAPLVITH
jgi:hypothetical protein